MKKLILLILLLSTTLNAQMIKRLMRSVQPQYSAQFSGGYYGKTVSGTLDLNLSEMLPNPTMDANVTGWLSSQANITYSTTVKRTGAGSALSVMTSAGNGRVGYFSISDATTKKLTAQVYIKPNRSQTFYIVVTDQASTVIATGAKAYLTSSDFGKLTLNCQLPGTQTGISFIVRVDTAQVGDSVWTDDASLTQSLDASASGIFNTTATGVLELMNMSQSQSSRLRFYLNNTTPTVTIYDGSGASVWATNSATVNDGKNHYWNATLNRTGNLTLYIDGVAGTGVSATGLGKLTIDTVRIGRGLFTNTFTGKAGHMRFDRFTALPTLTDYITRMVSNMKQGKPLTAPSGGDGAINLDWSPASFAKSGLSATGAVSIRRTK